MKPWTVLAAFFTLAQLSAPALAQQTSSEEIVVTARRVEEAVRAFVGEVTVEAGRSDQVARWDQRVCPGVAGLRAAQAQAIADRIAIRALEVGLDVGEPGCAPNILIIASSDSDALARDIVDEHRAMFGYYGDGVTRGRGALTDFVETPRPVRWWHVSQTLTADGFSTSGPRNAGEAPAVTGPATSLSRINRSTRQDLARAILIVDGRRVSGVSVGALGDYLAMAALAQIDPDADTSAFPTILNVFSQLQPGLTALTDWDTSYLQGLYSAPRDRSATSQANAIIRSVAEGQIAPTEN